MVELMLSKLVLLINTLQLIVTMLMVCPLHMAAIHVSMYGHRLQGLLNT